MQEIPDDLLQSGSIACNELRLETNLSNERALFGIGGRAGYFNRFGQESLTRDVPIGLGWVIEPIIRNLPKESLENTLRSTRTALVK